MSSRAQLLQLACSVSIACCLGAPVPVDGFRHVCSNTATALVTDSNLIQCQRISLGGGKVQQPQPFSAVLNNAPTNADNSAQMALCRIKALSFSKPSKRNLLVARGRGPLQPSSTTCMQLTERELAVSAAPSCALARQLQRSRTIFLVSIAQIVAANHALAVVADRTRALLRQLKRCLLILVNAFSAIREQPRLECA